jgi:hypothetical protein
VELAAHLVNLAGIAIATCWFLALFQAHIKVITQPGPQEYNEPAIWQTTFLLDHGRKPYSEEELPGAAYSFGPFYNYVVLAFKPLLGIDYSAHRTVNLIFLAASLWLMVNVMRKSGAGLGIALLSAVFYYWMSLLNIEITARPDLLGLFFFLLGIFVPWQSNYARWPSIFGLVCAVVAFQCKFYFAVAGCATLLGIFMVRSMREAIWLGLGYFTTLVLSFVVCWLYFPFFYIETIVEQKAGTALNSHDDISDMHTVMLFQRGWPFLLLMVFGLAAWFWRRHERRPAAAGPSGESSGPTSEQFLVLGLVFAIFLALVYFYMGRNAGAYFTYHLHLLLPLMLVLAAYAVTRPWMKIVFGLLLAVFVTCMVKVPVVPDSDGPYRRMEQLIYDCRGEVLAIPCVTDVMERTGRRVIHNGNTMFLGFALADNRAERDPMCAIIDRKLHETQEETETAVAARKYALVFTEFDDPMFCNTDLMKKNYEKVEQIDYYTYFGHSPVRVWRPKSPPADAGGAKP